MSYKFVTHIASVNRHSVWESKFIFFKNQIIYKTGVAIEKQDFMNQSVLVSEKSFVISQ